MSRARLARYGIGVLGLALGVLAGRALISQTSDESFPHEEHAGLFPTCVGCHQGAQADRAAAGLYTVEPADCVGCHDGVELKAVAWTGPDPEPSNLVFDHAEHARELEEEEGRTLDCQGCHRPADTRIRMAVDRAVESTCFKCHAPEAETHYAATGECATCHLSLASAEGLAASRIGDFPEPASHQTDGFVTAHGQMARTATADCAVCHTRESCERCHINASEIPAVAGLDRDTRVAGLMAGKPGEWPEPESHERPGWAWAHGEAAETSIETCANCHAERSCAACHQAGGPAVLARLPEAPRSGPMGVQIDQVKPIGHTADFVFDHAASAAAGAPNCAACHSEQQCVDCHDGASTPGFHPADFVMRHGAEAFANETECAACHSTEAFCRDCHMGVGVAATNRTTGGSFHDAQGNWLIAHGLPARQDLESCTTCHTQRSCLRCHSARTGWRVSPHGPGFDPAAVADKSTMSCAICHFSLPEGISP